MDKQKVLGESNDTTNVSIVSADDMAKVYFHTGLPDKIPDMTNENLKQNHSNSDSQNNLCNGSLLTTPSFAPRKIQNTSSNGHKSVKLSHLPKRPPVDINFIDLSYSVSEGHKRGYKTILKGISGQFNCKELTAIMGPSGAGKSTLMNILAGYKTTHLNGQVQINGKERNLRKFRKLSCYIMQDDCLMPYLSILEAMMISANLKLGKDISPEGKKAVVEEIIQTLGLTDCSNTTTINLSGGQRKRLSIALELVNNPPVMFFDEPTSGLDSSSCFQLISLLKSLAQGGRTIVCTIHQPSARLFEKFDNLYMLAEGQCIYQGSVKSLVPFLSTLDFNCPPFHNPADYLMEVACGEHGECIPKLVMAVNTIRKRNSIVPKNGETSCNTIANDISKQNSPIHLTTSNNLDDKPDSTFITITNQDDITKPSGDATCNTSLIESNESVGQIQIKIGFPTSGWLQFWILLKRSFLSIMRDKTLTHMRLLAHVLVGAIIGMIYYDIGADASKVMSNAGCIFFTTMFTMFTAMMPTILTFPQEMGVFVREHLNYWYSLKAFYFAKTVADLPFQIVFSSVYVIVIYYLTSQPMELQRVAMFVFILILTSLVAQSLGLLIGAGLSVETGVFLGPVTTIPTILFSGFFVNLDTIPGYLQWVTYVSYVRYGFEGAMVSIYGMAREKLDCSAMYCHFRSPKKFLEEMSMVNAEYWIDATALIGILVGLRICAYFVLRWKIHSIR